ncbi:MULTISPECIES: DUF6894 family protein [unclassified Mesorhizobium]|uniref:DUF6894 family protein n=1 Tax=unclassified Mesorhizobium TaxID=325217 RepID=UPI001CCFCAC5|nr:MULTISPECIES: hypothetical protein [unclassified Mesorhizobium]MBZ9682832.1 hypothetical protein [Mesorhizobium sp. CO1-1-2]MBZ9927621.1 hypothetical protein [Mesorhizobium sp. BR1-1-4]
MARYYFDLVDNGTSFPDIEGTELPSLEAAEDEAAKALLEIAKDQTPEGNFREVALHVRAGASKPLVMVKVTFELVRNGSDRDGPVGT